VDEEKFLGENYLVLVGEFCPRLLNMFWNQCCRRAGTVRNAVPVLVIQPKRTFRYFLSNLRERFLLTVPALIYNGQRWWVWIYDAPLFYLPVAKVAQQMLTLKRCHWYLVQTKVSYSSN